MSDWLSDANPTGCYDACPRRHDPWRPEHLFLGDPNRTTGARCLCGLTEKQADQAMRDHMSRMKGFWGGGGI